MEEQDLDFLTGKAADLIINAKKIVVFTGAGVSTESGIPDFRSPGGICEKYKPGDFTYRRFLSSPEARRKVWQMRRDGDGGIPLDAEPNPAHYAIAEMDRLGKLDCVITQNVDSLHQKAGLSDDKVIELHGSMQWAVCLRCGRRYPFEQIRVMLDRGEETPDCEICHGILKPDAVFFGESLPPKVLAEATRRSQSCDLFIVIGSTLVVTPAAWMPRYAINSGAKLVIINLSTTPMDSEATVVIRAKAGEVMPQIMQRVREKNSH